MRPFRFLFCCYYFSRLAHMIRCLVKRPLSSLCFRAIPSTKMAALASDLMKHVWFLMMACDWKTTFLLPNEKKKKFCYNLLYMKREICKRNQGIKKASCMYMYKEMSKQCVVFNLTFTSFKFVYFISIGKQRWPLWPVIGWVIFDPIFNKGGYPYGTEAWKKHTSGSTL